MDTGMASLPEYIFMYLLWTSPPPHASPLPTQLEPPPGAALPLTQVACRNAELAIIPYYPHPDHHPRYVSIRLLRVRKSIQCLRKSLIPLGQNLHLFRD